MKYCTLLLLLYNIYIPHYITITLSASHYKAIKIIQDTNWYEVKFKKRKKEKKKKEYDINTGNL